MNDNQRFFISSGAIAALMLMWTGTVPAGVIYQVTFDTTPLMGHIAAPFFLDFQLNDGSGTGNGSNTATMSDFRFGGGAAAGVPVVMGGASGGLETSVVVTDTGAFNEFYQEFIAGSSLSFRLELTTTVEAPAPDQFSMAILDGSYSELFTSEPFFGAAFLLIDITSPEPSVAVYASDPTLPPVAGGGGVSISAPTVTQVPVTPTIALLVFGFLGAAGRRRC